MDWKNLFKRKENKQPIVENRDWTNDYLTYNSLTSYQSSKSMLLSTVYRCVEVISDSVAQLHLETYKVGSDGHKILFTSHPAYNLLNRQPNKRMSRFTFLKTLIVSTLLRGNAFALIERDTKGNVVALHYLPSENVKIIKPRTLQDNISYNVSTIGKVEAKDMIHILNFSYDGIQGVSTLEHAKNTLQLSSDAEAHATGFFRGGANLAGILKVNSTLTDKQKQTLKTSWTSAFSPQTGAPNGIAVLEGNMDFQSITVNPADAQLLETREFNVVDICRFFGVSPVKAFDLSKSSYSTVEATQLAFLTDTLSPLLEKIELEFERKLFLEGENVDVRFDTSNLLRADKQSLAQYYNTLFNIGVISVNDIRKQIDLPAVEGGDNHFVQCNLMELKNASQNVPSNNAITNNINEEQ